MELDYSDGGFLEQIDYDDFEFEYDNLLMDSVSDNEFWMELAQSLTFPENTVFYIDDASIPQSWYDIEENMNDKLYLYIYGW